MSISDKFLIDSDEIIAVKKIKLSIDEMDMINELCVVFAYVYNWTTLAILKYQFNQYDITLQKLDKIVPFLFREFFSVSTNVKKINSESIDPNIIDNVIAEAIRFCWMKYLDFVNVHHIPFIKFTQINSPCEKITRVSARFITDIVNKHFYKLWNNHDTICQMTFNEDIDTYIVYLIEYV